MEDENSRAVRARQGSPFLTARQAAHYLGLSEKTLEKMRATDRGPHFRKHGRFVRYHIDDLDTWSQRKRQDEGSR
ncbi:MAG: helix-turn-helix domain-containing protein [Alphaproteobacteria bacterium]|nr:helix-turn-helix domain-containing protein [Alphaproteobacteria bacterium]